MNLRSEGSVQAVKVLFEIVKSGPEYIKKYVRPNERKVAKLTEDKALSLIIDARLTKFQYNIIRSNALEENDSPYPNYKSVIKAKKAGLY